MASQISAINCARLHMGNYGSQTGLWMRHNPEVQRYRQGRGPSQVSSSSSFILDMKVQCDDLRIVLRCDAGLAHSAS